MSDDIILSHNVREEIDRWIAKFPEGKERSAVIAALHAVQHANNGYLTVELMNGVAEYLNLPEIQVEAWWLQGMENSACRRIDAGADHR